MLSHHIDSQSVLDSAKDHPHLSLLNKAGGGNNRVTHGNIHAGRYQTEGVPKYSLPEVSSQT
jgi:glutamate decarboxylase